MKVYYKEQLSYVAAERANKVERLQLEQQCKLFEKEYRYARRQLVMRREEARHEARRLQQQRISADTTSVSPRERNLYTDRVESHDGRSTPRLSSCSVSPQHRRKTSSTPVQNSKAKSLVRTPSRSSGMFSVNEAACCEKDPVSAPESDQTSCASRQGSYKKFTSNGRKVRDRMQKPSGAVTEKNLLNQKLSSAISGLDHGPKSSGMPSVAARVKPCSNTPDSEKDSCSLPQGNLHKPQRISLSSSSIVGASVGKINSLCGSDDSTVSEGPVSTMSQYKTGDREKLAARFEDKHRHIRRYYGDLVTTILNRPPATLPHPKTNKEKEEPLIVLEAEENAEDASEEPCIPNISSHSISTELPTQYSLADDTSHNKTPRQVQFAFMDETTSNSKAASFKLLSDRRRSLPTNALLESTTSLNIPNTPRTRRCSIDVTANAMSTLESKTSLNIPNTPRTRRLSFDVTANAMSTLESKTSLNIPNTPRTRRRSFDVTANAMSTDGITHRRRMSEQALPDATLLHKAAEKTDSSSAMPSPQPEGWRKLRSFVSTIACLKKSAAPSNVEARMARRNSSTVRLLSMLNEVNKNRPTRELLEMDRERQRLASGGSN